MQRIRRKHEYVDPFLGGCQERMSIAIDPQTLERVRRMAAQEDRKLTDQIRYLVRLALDFEEHRTRRS